MPVFHFNVYDGVRLPDEDGTDLPDWRQAEIAAIELAGSLIREGAIEPLREWHMEVTDERGLILFTIDFDLRLSPALHGANAKPH